MHLTNYKPIICTFGIAAAILASSPAFACMNDPLPNAVLFDRVLSEVPPDHIVIGVRSPSQAPRTGPIKVKVLSSPKSARIAQIVWIIPEAFSSCTQWGRLGANAFAVVRTPTANGSRSRLVARVYDRSWLDKLLDLVGYKRFTATGDPMSYPFSGKS
jgi:hypothetical protein